MTSNYLRDCLEALEIAKRSRTHSVAVVAIVARGLAEDRQEADAMICEAETWEAMNGR